MGTKVLLISNFASINNVESLNKLFIGEQAESVLPPPTAEEGPLRLEDSNS
jgi:hypothetical protein